MAGKDAVSKVGRVIDGEEQVFYVMRRSLRFLKEDQWMIRDDCSVSRAVAEAAVSAALATTAAEAQPALLALGAQLPLHEDINLTSRSGQRYCVVGMGRWCSAKWQQQGSLAVPWQGRFRSCLVKGISVWRESRYFCPLQLQLLCKSVASDGSCSNHMRSF